MILLCLFVFCIIGSDQVIAGRCAQNADNVSDYSRCRGDLNATYKECPNPCPRTCQFPGGTGFCSAVCLKEGCECKDGYYLSENGKCVQLQDCPGAIKCTANETFAFCNVGCPSNICPEDDSRGVIACSPPFPCGSGCSCKGGYLRLSPEDERCILAYECPPIPCTRPNEEWNGCPPACLNERCPDIGSPNECDLRFFTCRPQCICKPGYFRDDNDICVHEKECSPSNLCGYNEKPSDCRVRCPPQTCESICTTYPCGDNDICEPGCDCLDGYLRNASGICVPSEECYLVPECNIPNECRATCANPNPQNCLPADHVTDNQDGCKCKPGYILSESNCSCIRIEDCPTDKGCNGDENAIATSCPWPCPSTCDSPNAGTCGKKCDLVGCQCKPGYILSETNGICILFDECAYGNPCGVNGTYVECAFRCPNQNCPEDDSGLEIACRPGRPCPPGCLCKEYYRRKSEADDTCVLASDCPIVNCTRPNEIWNPCASECLAETCSDIDRKIDCFPDLKSCQPKCVCDEGFYRNNTGYCVSKDQCEPLCQVQQECRPTCAVPNPSGCIFITPSQSNEDDCNCQQGYILSEIGGKCIKIEECTTGIGCNGDLHARVKECPLPCPSTCDAPNATPCKRRCDPIGCECEPGYILDNGQCILPYNCNGGNPCGPNSTFVQCRYNCPSFYCPVDDSRAVAVCETSPFSPCFSGCVCKLNHKILSSENPICIRSDECPEIDCTRPHEKWDPCPIECSSGYCEEVDNPTVTCNTLVLNCNPQCVCKKTFLRDPKTDICVTSNECRIINKENEQYFHI